MTLLALRDSDSSYRGSWKEDGTLNPKPFHALLSTWLPGSISAVRRLRCESARMPQVLRGGLGFWGLGFLGLGFLGFRV